MTKRAPPPGYHIRCDDCDTDTAISREYYMVKGSVWKLAARRLTTRILCVECLEKRIGRTLDSSDFSDAPINHREPSRYSPRLWARLNTCPRFGRRLLGAQDELSRMGLIELGPVIVPPFASNH